MPDLESHWLAERLAYLGRVLTGDSVWRRKASRTFPRLNSDPLRVGPACFRFFRPGKQSASNFIDGGMEGQPNREFFPYFSCIYIFRVFFLSFPSYPL